MPHRRALAGLAALLLAACVQGTDRSVPPASSGGAGGSASPTGGASGGPTGGVGGPTGGAPASGGESGNTGGSAASPDAGGGSPDSGGADRPAGSGSDGAGGGAASGCSAGVTTTFCTDFEDGTAGEDAKGMFTLDKGGYATMTIDGAQKWSGKQSMRIRLNNSPDSGHARLQFSAPLMPLPSNHIFGRLMVYLSRNVKNHWDLVTAFASKQIDDSESVTQDTFGSYGSDGHIESVHQPGDDSVDSTTKFPVGKWACLQWEFDGNPAAHAIRVKLDGQFIDKGMMMAKSGWKPATFNSMGIGWINFEGGVSGMLDLWLDDVAFGSQEIPCPAQ